MGSEKNDMEKIAENKLEKIIDVTTLDGLAAKGVTVKWSWNQFGQIIRITSTVGLPAEFLARTKVIETHRMFRFDDGLVATREEQMIEQLERAGQDLLEKLGFIWQANHGMLDSNIGTIRFNA